MVRPDNQDNILCLDDVSVYVVADGMGGGSAGALASKFVCEAVAKGVTSPDYQTRLGEIGEAIASANRRIFSYSRDHGYRQMGTTVALLSFDTAGSARGAIGYVGDSRVYRVRGKEAALLTRDHSVGAEMAAMCGAKMGSVYSARSNPLAHVLTRAIGTDFTVALEWRKVDIADGDRFVICSDGVHDVIETEELEGLVGNVSLEAAAEALEREIVARGAPDNYSFVIVDFSGY